MSEIRMAEVSDHLYSKAAARRIPISGTFELTPLCNFACRMCYVRKTPEQVKAHDRAMLEFDDWLRIAREGREQGLLFLLLTGGASRMPFFRDTCKEIFPNAITVCCPEPEFSIAKGLAYAGWIEENLRAFRKAINEEITDARINVVVRQSLPELMPSVIDALVDLLMDEAALPIYRDWQRGKLLTLGDMNTKMQQRMAEVLDSPMTEEACRPHRKSISGISCAMTS